MSSQSSSNTDSVPNPDEFIALVKALLDGKLESSSRYKEIFDLKISLDAETDRGCSLMIGAYLDELLKIFLSSLFVADANASVSFLRADGPLGTFSSRIELCYLLGQISEVVRRELHLMRKIRNEFAHTVQLINFSQPAVLARIRELKCTGLSTNADARHRMIRSCLFIAADFHAMMWVERRLTIPSNPKLDIYETVANLLEHSSANFRSI
jgi:DNA-binding MltR family transcriptional regulator